MKLPTFKSNSPTLANGLNVLARAVEQLYSRPFTGSGSVDVYVDPDGGVAIHGKGSSPAASTAAVNHPFKPYIISGLDIKLIPGTANNILPTNWNSELTLSSSATGRWVYLEVTIDQYGDVTEVSIEEAAAPPTPDSPSDDGTIPTTLYLALFAYDSTTTSVTRFIVAQQENVVTEVTLTDEGCSDVYRSVRLINA